MGETRSYTLGEGKLIERMKARATRDEGGRGSGGKGGGEEGRVGEEKGERKMTRDQTRGKEMGMGEEGLLVLS